MKMTNYLIENLKQSEKERQNSDYYSFNNTDEAIDFIGNIIDGKSDKN